MKVYAFYQNNCFSEKFVAHHIGAGIELDVVIPNPTNHDLAKAHEEAFNIAKDCVQNQMAKMQESWKNSGQGF